MVRPYFLLNADNLSTLDALAKTLSMETTFVPSADENGKSYPFQLDIHVNVGGRRIRVYCPVNISRLL